MEYEERENEKEDYRTDPLTSGTLGIPGVCLLYGITFYQIL